MKKFFYGDFHLKLKVSFEFFRRDFPGKNEDFFLVRFSRKIEGDF